MKHVEWNEEKNEQLIRERGISFEMCLEAIVGDGLLAIVSNHPPFEHQQVFILAMNGYVYEVPFVEDNEKIFLKTAYPSHEAKKKFQ